MKRNRFLIACLAVFALLALCLGASAQIPTYNLNSVSLMSNTWVEVQGTNTFTNAVPSVAIKTGYPFALEANIVGGTSTNATSVSIQCDTSRDGTTFTTDQPVRLGLTFNGTTRVLVRTNYTANTWDGFSYIKLTKVVPTSTNGFHLTNVVLSYKY
jgi:hypothetical protein